MINEDFRLPRTLPPMRTACPVQIHAVWKVCVIRPSNSLEEISAVVHDDHLVAFKVAYIVYIAGTVAAKVRHGQVGRLLHVF